MTICRQELNLELSKKSVSAAQYLLDLPCCEAASENRGGKGMMHEYVLMTAFLSVRSLQRDSGKHLINLMCLMIKEHSRLEALVIEGVTAGPTLGLDFGFMFLRYKFFLHKFPIGVH